MNRFKNILLTSLAVIGLAGALLLSSAKTEAAASSYQYPCSPWALSGYTYGQHVSGWGYHAGQDMACSAGAPVYAVAEGQVVYSAKTPDSYRWGNLILIHHQNPDGEQVTSLYGHLSGDRRVAAGQTVAKGQLIGFVGAAYTAENGNWGDHIHFGIRSGAYGASVGTYAPGIVGYASGSALPQWAHPTNFINARKSGPVAPPPAPAPLQINDYQYVSTSISGLTAAKTGEYWVEIKLRNTGNTTWGNRAPHEMRLGTSRPRDRVSGFSVTNDGWWAGGTRINMLETAVPPGSIGTFKAKFSNRHVAPGSYAEYFTPVRENLAWFPDRGIYLGLNVNSARYSAEAVGQSAYWDSDPTNLANPFTATYLTPGQKMNVKVYVRNAGEVAWSSGGQNPVRLGTSHPIDRASPLARIADYSIPASENWLVANRASTIDGRYDPNTQTVTPTGTIQPGEIGAFSFTITAPAQPGSYAEYFQPVAEGASWMNDTGLWIPVRVLPPGFHYENASQDNPDPVAFGGGEQVNINLRNAGQSPWPIGGTVRLGTDRGRDRLSGFAAADWLAGNRPSAVDRNLSHASKDRVDPGEVGQFSFSISNPSSPDGSYQEYLQPVVDGQGWMPEAYGTFFPVKVESPPWAQRWVGQRFDTDISRLQPGQEFTATLIMQNLGSQTWLKDGPNQVRVGTWRPTDRGSGFADLTGSDAWLAPNRASQIDGRVTQLVTAAGGPGVAPASEIRQGELAYFKIPMKVPAVPAGAYPEYFNLVAENATWLNDLGVYFPFFVIGS